MNFCKVCVGCCLLGWTRSSPWPWGWWPDTRCRGTWITAMWLVPCRLLDPWFTYRKNQCVMHNMIWGPWKKKIKKFYLRIIRNNLRGDTTRGVNFWTAGLKSMKFIQSTDGCDRRCSTKFQLFTIITKEITVVLITNTYPLFSQSIVGKLRRNVNIFLLDTKQNTWWVHLWKAFREKSLISIKILFWKINLIMSLLCLRWNIRSNYKRNP